MSKLLIRANEGCAPDPFLLWDSVHRSIEDGTDFVCDWILAFAPNNALNVGGLQAINGLGTAVYLALFTDKYVPPDHPLAYLADGDNRGWWGDGVDVRADLGEQQLGSWLWLLERAPLVAAGVGIDQWAQSFAIDALTPLMTQGAVAGMQVDAALNEQFGRTDLSVSLFGSDGGIAFEQRFALLWKQIANAPRPLL
jgi:phage gp46-like protein